MAQSPEDRAEYRPIRQADLGGGVNNSHNETLIAPNEAADALNVDFDRDAVSSTNGSIKFNNQTAPGSAVRTRVDPAMSPLMQMAIPLGGAGTTGITGTVDTPLRGYVYLPYSQDTDIGGRFDSEGSFIAGTETFHTRRGRSFEINVSFMLPAEEKLYEPNSKGVNAIAVPNPSGGANPFDPYNGFDEALDECFCILQKGGDRCSPMSWALAVVNVGNGVGLGGSGALWPNIPATRPSNYALVFMWYDSAGWGEVVAGSFKYNLTTAQHPTSGGGSQYGTQAYRAVLIHKYIEPGRRYSVAVQLNMDTGTPGTVTGGGTNTAWIGDGYFKAWVSEEGEAATSYSYVDTGAVSVGVDVMKGPTDSLSYLCRYGIRFAGRDARFGGLGQRFVPWAKMGFIPFGADLAPLKSGGFSMVDRTTVDRTALYGATTATLTVQKNATADAYLVLGHRFMVSGNTNGGYAPNSPSLGAWQGFGTSTTLHNANSLRGYRIAATGTGDTWASYQTGGILTLLDYFESGGTFRINILDGASGRFGLIGPAYPWIQCFRWHQRELVIGQIRTWGAPRAYSASNLSGSRRLLSLHSSLRLDDSTEPDIATLLEEYRCDDSEGALVRETVVGGYRNGFLCPFGNATTDGGSEGGHMVFLSGEGEAIALDLSDDPVFQREVQRMLADDSQGFGFELSMVQTEAVYALAQTETLPDQGTGVLAGLRPHLAPDLISWDVKESTARVTPRPLLTMGFRSLMTTPDTRPFRKPMAFGVAVAHASDQENFDQVTPQDLMPWYLDAAAVQHNRYDTTAPWVGKLVTIQVGIQRTAVADQYDVYIAMTPKDAFLPANGDPSDAEFAYWTDGVLGTGGLYNFNNYFTAAHLTIDRKDLVRSVLTVGGRWNCLGKSGDTTNLGVSELNARMLVDKVRWFITSPSGALPAVSGGILTSRNGKLEGTNALPQRLLTSDDLLQPLGNGVRSANLIQGSTSVTPPTQTALYVGEAAATLQSVKGSFLAVSGDEVRIPKVETFGLKKRQWYGIDSATATAAVLRTAYVDPTRSGAVAGVFRLAGYTAFEDDVRDRVLTLGKGKSYAATGITVADVILTDVLWENLAVPGGGFKLRIYSPLGRSSAAAILPQWTRGLVTERRGPEDGILGSHGFGSKLYQGVQGAIFEVDDRWRARDWTDSNSWGVAFRARSLPADVSAPLHADMMRLDSCASVALPETFSDATMHVIDARGFLDAIGEYQMILWLGDPTTDPYELAGTTTGKHAFQFAVRLNRGRPELVLGSTAFYTGSTRPEKGLFIATGQQAVPVGEKFHVRFYLWTRSSGTIIGKPWCKVNGKKTAVTINAVDTGVSGAYDWMLRSTLVSPSAAALRLLVGVGRDSYRAADADLTFSASTIQGTLKSPQRLAGYLHSFNGELSDLVISRETASANIATQDPPDFDPNNITYSGTLKLRLLNAGLGVGHRTLESVTGTYATIISHPFVSVYHEMGVSEKPMHFTEYGSQLYAVNGGKPAVIIDNVGYQAGVVAPLVAPSFVTERSPLWKPNVRGTGTDDSYDPILQAATAAAQQLYHLNTTGNAYLKAQLDGANATLMSWDKDDYIHVKFYVRPRAISGRIQLWRRADGSKSGSIFADIYDGKVRIGWYDQNLKEEVYLESSGPLFQSNDVHYFHIRKRWPVNDGLETNWQNSYFSDGRVRRMTLSGSGSAGIIVGNVIQNGATDAASTAQGFVTKVLTTAVEYVLTSAADFASANAVRIRTGVGTSTDTTRTVSGTPIRPMNDVCTVRRFKRNGELASSMNAVVGSVRNRVSLTTNTLTLPAGTNGTGLVSAPGCVFIGGAAGVVTTTSTVPARGNVFSADMVGMYWIWGTGATSVGVSVAGRKYRITTFTSASSIAVVDEETGVVPSFATTTAETPGGVFTGIELKKSTNFDNSKAPDNSRNTIEMMGSSIQGQVTGEYAAFSGEMYSIAYGVSAGAGGTGALCFENLVTTTAINANDPITVGSDAFAVENYNGAGEPAALQVDNLLSVWCTDCRVYAGTYTVSSQPSTTLVVTGDPHGASGPTTTSTDIADPRWTYIQPPTQWSVQRQIAVAFFDKRQNIVGNPSPQLAVKALSEDSVNPSGAIRVRLTNLPISRADTEIWIYESVGDGSSGALFRVAQVDNGTAEATIQFNDDETAESGIVLEFTNSDPPRCDIVETSGSRVIYGALEVQPDAFVASKPGFPGNVDFVKVARLNSGFGERLTAIRDLDGSLVIFKRRCVSSWVFDNANNPIPAVVTNGVGCVAHATAQALDGVIVFLSEKGLHIVAREGVTNLAKPMYIGRRLSDFFRDDADTRRYDRAVACLNIGRNQYVLAFKLDDEAHQNARVSVEVREGGGFRFSIYRHPNVTSMCSVVSKDGGQQRMVFGSEEGFALWADDSRTAQAALGSTADHGRRSVTVTTGGSTSGAVVSGTSVDTSLEGVRGTLVRWVDADGVARSANVLGSSGQYVHFSDVAAVAPRGAMTVGSPGFLWESGWMDMGNCETLKTSHYLDLVIQPQASGTMIVRLYQNFDEETELEADDDSNVLDLTLAKHRVSYPNSNHGTHFKVVLESGPDAVDTVFELSAIVWRASDDDQT